MQGVFPVKRAVFIEFQLFLHIPPVFFGSVIFPLTFAALEGDEFHRRLLTRHNVPFRFKFSLVAEAASGQALKRNRTADRILTMDVLYRLSYKGIKTTFYNVLGT